MTGITTGPSSSTACGWQRLFVGAVALVGWITCLSILASAIAERACPPFDTVLVCFVILPCASFLFSRFALRGLLTAKPPCDAESPRSAIANF